MNTEGASDSVFFEKLYDTAREHRVDTAFVKRFYAILVGRLK